MLTYKHPSLSQHPIANQDYRITSSGLSFGRYEDYCRLMLMFEKTTPHIQINLRQYSNNNNNNNNNDDNNNKQSENSFFGR